MFTLIIADDINQNLRENTDILWNQKIYLLDKLFIVSKYADFSIPTTF